MGTSLPVTVGGLGTESEGGAVAGQGVLPSGADHIVVDASGAYFCLLRRDTDLAALRRQFNGGP
jgi:hypothetical protein